MICYKKAMCDDGNEVVLELFVPREAKKIYIMGGKRALRASKAKVLCILDVWKYRTSLKVAYSEHNPNFKYVVGEWAEAPECSKENGKGIYMWRAFHKALEYWPGCKTYTWRANCKAV